MLPVPRTPPPVPRGNLPSAGLHYGPRWVAYGSTVTNAARAARKV